MIDPVVAYDKLSNFETAEEIREYFQECGIRGVKGRNDSCAIAQWLIETTGEKLVNVGETIRVGVKANAPISPYPQILLARDPKHRFNRNWAITEFIKQF